MQLLRIVGFGLIGLVLLAAACGGDDDSAAGTSTPATQESGGSDTSADSGPAADCPALPYTVSLKAGDAVDSDAFEVVSAKAVSLGGGAAYTVYLADYEIPDDQIGAFTNPSPQTGQTLVTLFVTTFNAPAEPEEPEVGMVIPYSPDFGVLTFKVLPQSGETSFGTTMSAEGELTVLQTGDFFCAEVAYQDSKDTSDLTEVQNRFSGTVAAEVVLTLN